MKAIVVHFKSIFFPGLILGCFIGGIFGVTAILDGYGDTKLFIYYVLVFSFIFSVVNLILTLYERLRKITITVFNQLFLLSATFLSFFVLFVTNYMIKFVFKSIHQPSYYHFPRNLSFIFSLLFFFWLSSLQRKVPKNICIIFTVCLAFIWLYISVNGEISLKKDVTVNQDAPNVLLLTVESLRYDYLGCSGNREIKTPYIDKLAEKGVFFDNYFVQAPYTTASLSTLMTGCYPFKHESRAFGEKPDYRYRPFFEELVKKGYFVKIDASYFEELFPYHSIFDTQRSSILKKMMTRLEEVIYITNDRVGNYLPFLFGSYCLGNETSMKQTSRLLRRIRLHRNKTWFFWTHFISNCHWPYKAPPQFTKIYKKAMVSNKTTFSIEDLDYLNKNPDSITKEISKGIKIAYSAEVTCIDRQIGIIISKLKSLSLLKKTVIILSTDHGELLGETKYIGHGKFLVDKLIHVPLIIYTPDFGCFEEGKRINNLIEEVDVAPTILDICGIDSTKLFDGSSLLNIFNSKGWHKNSIYSEVVQDGKFFFACFRTKEHKLIWNAANNEFSLYNIIHDPYEKQNLINKLPEESAKMRHQFHNFLGYSNLFDLKPVIKPKIDKKMKEKMRALGYIN